ncbi:hypothetical protein JZU46_02770 [bacterium]|nr:hypothetical protein [bacterium]
MSSYKTKFLNNMFENVIISEMLKVYNEDIYDKCFMDVSTKDNLIQFYLEQLHAALVTVVCGDKESKYIHKFRKEKYIDYDQIDVLRFALDERIGAFKQQYNIITAFNTLDTYVDDHIWQTSVENLLSYLKPGGICFVNGTFLDTKIVGNVRKLRSKGVWKVLAKKCGCYVDTIIENPLVSIYENDKIMVIRK